MTLAELALTVTLLGGLGLVASRFGLSAIPAYLLAGLLLGPNDPTQLALIEPSEVTEFVAELGIVFLLFFLGLEFTFDRVTRSQRHAVLGGAIDFAVNAGLGLLVGVAAFGFDFAALILAAAIYVSSSAIAVRASSTSGASPTTRPTWSSPSSSPRTWSSRSCSASPPAAAGAQRNSRDRQGGRLRCSVACGFEVALALDRPRPRLAAAQFFLLALFGFVVGMSAIAQELGSPRRSER